MTDMQAPSSEAPRDQDKITAHARKELQAILGAIESYERELWSNDQALEQLDLVLVELSRFGAAPLIT
jgi:hypothetical protein